YLEQYEFRLVSEALAERETLLRIAPHLVTPLTFVLPWLPGMRSRLLLRLGLWLYDHLARRTVLAPSQAVRFADSPLGLALQPQIAHGLRYSACGVDDALLGVFNCVGAARRGASIFPRTQVGNGARDAGHWRVTVQGPGGRGELRARALVNAAGP